MSENNVKDNDFINPKDLKLSVFGSAPWWDSSYEYRILINVTNTYGYDFTNYGVEFSFNYEELVQAGKMQADLDDVRIVENEDVRNYYIIKDYPSQDYATIFFDTDILASMTETDTYMYFGNVAAVNAEADQPNESFGWVKNGDFELDIDSSDKFEPYGWYFSHNPVDEIMGLANPTPTEINSSATSFQLFVNKLINTPAGGERVANGNFAYKWGTPDTTLSGGNINDYAGTLFTYPFTVPNVDGGISLSFYRNIRTFRFEEPKNPPGPGPIDIDGYFIRVLNGSNGVYDTNPDNHDDDDIDPTYGNYAEVYDGHAWYNPSSKKWTDDTMLKDFSVHTLIHDTKSDSSADGDLTGYSEIDLTPYMGKEIFFEIGAWGDESNAERKQKDAFFQVDDLKFNYTLSTSANEVQARKSDVTVIARDIDGRIVPNAEIIMINKSSQAIISTGFTSELNGSISFDQLLNGEYNITANYTLGSNENYVGSMLTNFSGKEYTVEITLNLWTIDFEIVDWDGIPLSYGFIEVNESISKAFVEKLTLDSNGKATFRWLYTQDYYIRVFYENEDYTGTQFLLNESTLYRNIYDRVGAKYQTQSLWVNNTNRNLVGENSYAVSERVYSNGSLTDFGNSKLIKVNVSLTDMINQLENVYVYYIDKDNSTGTGTENLIYFENGYAPGTSSDFIELDIPKVDNVKLQSEKFEAYGLLIEVNGVNFTQCDGNIKIDTIETCNIYNRTHLARMDIKVVNINPLTPEGAPLDTIIKVTNNATGESIINLTSNSGREGLAFGQINDIPFWFFKDRVYNFSIDVINITNVEFNVSAMSPVDQWRPTSSAGVNWYNYTLYGGASLTFNVIFSQDINISNYITSFFNTTGTEVVFWGEDLIFSTDFRFSVDDAQSWSPVISPDADCFVYIRNVGSEINLIAEEMVHLGSGNYSITINSNLLSAGGDSNYYSVKIEGFYPGYPDPSLENILIQVKSIPTEIKSYDYDSLTELQGDSLTAYYDELINITIRYSIAGSGNPLNNSLLSYDWIGLGPISFSSDPLNSGYYTFIINTADAQSTGLKVISITAFLENYTSQENFLIYLNILQRRTTLNDNSDLVYMSPLIWVQDTHYYTFTYRDANTLDIIGDLNIKTFSWYELDEFGDRIPGNQGTGTLIQNLNKTYYVDFDTELKHVGFYFFHITLQKENYEPRFAYINLQIKLREFEVSLEGTEPTVGNNNQIRVAQGADVLFEISLIDLTRGNIALENAQITLNLGGIDYSFNGSLGIYTRTFRTNAIDTFITSKTLAGKITVEMDNFTTQEISITVIVAMEEIFSGMPTFYFILIIASVIGVVGSIVGYRVIQQARIPKHVKKIRKLKSAIKSKKKIADTFAIPSKAEMIAKLFGDDWKELGLSINETLGIKDLKSKKPPVNDKIVKDKFNEGGQIE